MLALARGCHPIYNPKKSFKMGTLPSSSFVNINFRFRLLPRAGDFRARGSVSIYGASRNLCGLCREKRPQVSEASRRFNAFRCFSMIGGDGEEEKSSSSSQASEVGRESGKDDLQSERSPASISSSSSRVLGFFFFFGFPSVLA